jgi:GT2 family glycosyltransferase
MATRQDTRLHVVVPAYGESPLLPHTLASLVTMVPASIRVSVLDDASPTDAVRRHLEPFKDRIEYWRNDRNMGVSGAFNEAMRRSSGLYTVLVGPDDRAVSTFAATYLHAMKTNDGAAAIHPYVTTIDQTGAPGHALVDRTKQVLRPRLPSDLGGRRLARGLLVGNWTYNPAIAWRTEFVLANPFDECLHTAMDLDLLLRLAFAGETLHLTDGRALEYRRHAGAVSSVNGGAKRLREELEIHARAARTAMARGWWDVAAAAKIAPTARANGVLMGIVAKGEARGETLRVALSGW